MARLVVRNGHYKDTCYVDIGVCAPHLDTIVGLNVNTTRRVYVPTLS
jgi:hypothetical protein